LALGYRPENAEKARSKRMDHPRAARRRVKRLRRRDQPEKDCDEDEGKGDKQNECLERGSAEGKTRLHEYLK
jgi:hypothetical protein